MIDVLGHEQSPPFDKSLKNLLLLQSLFAKMHGFPTSGTALNTMTLLLHLCKPIKAEQAVSFSAFFPSRGDVEELMGSWVKEARFGEVEQVEAAQEVAKADPQFSAPLADKSLFKTEIFWLATKGIGTLLLPVIKEAFHTFQGIAGYFLHKDKGWGALGGQLLDFLQEVDLGGLPEAAQTPERGSSRNPLRKTRFQVSGLGENWCHGPARDPENQRPREIRRRRHQISPESEP